MPPQKTTAFVDNIDNSCASAESELSDLYACRIPCRVKTPGGPIKTQKITFGSFEHAWNVLRFVRFPVVGTVHQISTVESMSQTFEVSFTNATLFIRQFEEDGVFCDWNKFSNYYDGAKITDKAKNNTNIGLIARYVCSNDKRSEGIRISVRAVAANRFRCNPKDSVSQCIAACLWKCDPNLTSYVACLRKLCVLKYQNNHRARNALCQTGILNIQTNLEQSRIVTETRRNTSAVYMKIVLQQRDRLHWTLWTDATLALAMAFHKRLGQHSCLGRISADLFLLIIAPIVSDKQHKKITAFSTVLPPPTQVRKKCDYTSDNTM